MWCSFVQRLFTHALWTKLTQIRALESHSKVNKTTSSFDKSCLNTLWQGNSLQGYCLTCDQKKVLSLEKQTKAMTRALCWIELQIVKLKNKIMHRNLRTDRFPEQVPQCGLCFQCLRCISHGPHLQPVRIWFSLCVNSAIGNKIYLQHIKKKLPFYLSPPFYIYSNFLSPSCPVTISGKKTHTFFCKASVWDYGAQTWIFHLHLLHS